MTQRVKAPRGTTLAAGGLAGIALLIFLGAFALFAAGCLPPWQASTLPRPTGLNVYLGLVPNLLYGLSFAALGLLLRQFRPENRIGWMALLFSIAHLTSETADIYGVCALLGQAPISVGTEVLWLGQVATTFAAITFGLFLLLFPDGRFLSRRWRNVAFCLFTLLLLAAAITAVWPGAIIRSEFAPPGALGVNNPFALSFLSAGAVETTLFQVRELGILVFVLFALVSLLVRWRRATGDTRLQLRWVAFFLIVAITPLLLVLVVGNTVNPDIVESPIFHIGLTLLNIGVPVIFGLALFKYRLYDIDFIIRRTVQYALVTAILVLVYFGAVVSLQTVIGRATGDQSPLAIVISTLLIVALFNPLRRRVQRMIDKRFFRQKYDSQQILARFARVVEDETDMAQLWVAINTVVQDALQPDQLSIWINQRDQR